MSELLTREMLLSFGRRRVALSDGTELVIRKLKRAELAMMAEALPDVTTLARADPASRTTEDVAKSELLIHRIIAASVMEPHLSLDPAEGPTPGDIGYQDQLLLFQAILEHSGFTKKAADEVLPLSETNA